MLVINQLINGRGPRKNCRTFQWDHPVKTLRTPPRWTLRPRICDEGGLRRGANPLVLFAVGMFALISNPVKLRHVRKARKPF